MTYIEKLKDPRWQKKRLKILERDGFKCVMCGCETETLHVHHKFYLKNKDPWDYDDKYLTTLCEACHWDETDSMNDYLHDLILEVRKNCTRDCVMDIIISISKMSFYNLDVNAFFGKLSSFNEDEFIEFFKRFF